jgi:hypothetical protein
VRQGRGPWRARQSKSFFFEKKHQKTFVGAPRRRVRTCQIDKSFLVLFFKKELLASLPGGGRAVLRTIFAGDHA